MGMLKGLSGGESPSPMISPLGCPVFGKPTIQRTDPRIPEGWIQALTQAFLGLLRFANGRAIRQSSQGHPEGL